MKTLLILGGIGAMAGGFWLGRASGGFGESVSAGAIVERTASAPPAPAVIAPPPEATADSPTPTAFIDDLIADRSEVLVERLRALAIDRSVPPLIAEIQRNALVERLVALGAGGRVLELTELSGKTRDSALTTLTRAIAATDPSAAEALVGRQASARDRRIAMGALLSELGERNPARGRRIIAENPEARESAGALFAGWARVDPAAAAAAALAEEPRSERAIWGVTSAWAAEDPDAAWEWVESLSPEDRFRSREVYLSALIAEDPALGLEALATKRALSDSYMAQWVGMAIADDVAEADAAVDRLPPGRGRTGLIGGLAHSLSSDPEAVLAWADSLLPGESEAVVDGLFRGLVRLDPAAALNLAVDKIDGAPRRTALRTVASAWAQNDFEAAFAGLTSRLDGDLLRETLPGIFEYGFASDEASLTKRFDLVDRLEPATRKTVMTAMGGSIGMDPTDGLLDRVERMSREDREAFAEGSMDRWFDRDPSQVSRLVGMLGPETQARHARSIAGALPRQDLGVTADYLRRLPDVGDGGSKRSAIEYVVGDWTSVDPGAAAGFVASLPAGETKDAAARSVVRQLSTFDLDRATRVAANTTTPKIRAELIGELAERWREVDPNRGRSVLGHLVRTVEERERAAALLNPK